MNTWPPRRDHNGSWPASRAADPRTALVRRPGRPLGVEHERVCARIRHLNHALAWSAARWAVDQAAAARRDGHLPGGPGHPGGPRAPREATPGCRGRCAGIVEAIRHLAAKAAIAVVTVPARGTSKYCPRCGEGTRTPAPGPGPARRAGLEMGPLPGCGLSWTATTPPPAGSSPAACSPRHATRTDRSTGTRTIRTIVEGNVARARRPRRPTRAARRARRTRTDLHPRPAARDRAKKRPTPKRPTRTSANARNNSDDFQPCARPAHGARPTAHRRWTASGGPCTQAGTAPAVPDRACQEFSPSDRLPPRQSHPRAHVRQARGGPSQATPVRVT